MGSSPLARGPRDGASWLKLRHGLIPARAGTTNTSGNRARRGGAHPRSRGDHTRIVTLHALATGSSPLARGPLNRLLHNIDEAGLIPARAGTTSVLNAAFKELGAHPRSRGDHPLKKSVNALMTGSSPLARGPLVANLVAPLLLGLIPARAGTTAESGGFSSFGGAHPRSRGDHITASARANSSGGSSPLARGPLCGRTAAEP